MTRHAGYGRYDVEVNGQVVGRAVKRPEGWEATGAMPGVEVTVYGHQTLESACMAIGRALMGSGVLRRCRSRPATGDPARQTAACHQNAEQELSDAYLRLRNILGAFDTPRGPTAEQVWAHTEDRAKGLVAQLQKLREEASIWKGMHAVAIEQNDQLKAQVERLREGLNLVSNALHNASLELGTDHHVDSYGAMACDAWGVLKETPTQSLAEHDAALLRDWGVSLARQAYPKYEDKFGEGHYVAMTNMSRELHMAANRLEKEAAK